MSEHACRRWRAVGEGSPSVCIDCGKRFHNPCPLCGEHIGPFSYDHAENCYCGSCGGLLPEPMAAELMRLA